MSPIADSSARTSPPSSAGRPAGGSGRVASFDEDTTTMGFEAARLALRAIGGASPDALWFATAEPAYVEKTNATAIHAALRLDSTVAVMDVNGAFRSGVGAFLAAARGVDEVLVSVAGMRGGLPLSADEAEGGDGGAALLVGNDGNGPVIAEYLGGASETRGVRRSLADARLAPTAAVGGALRRDGVRAHGRAGLERGPQVVRAEPGSGRRRRRHRDARPGGAGRGRQAGCQIGCRQSRRRGG